MYQSHSPHFDVNRGGAENTERKKYDVTVRRGNLVVIDIRALHFNCMPLSRSYGLPRFKHTSLGQRCLQVDSASRSKAALPSHLGTIVSAFSGCSCSCLGACVSSHTSYANTRPTVQTISGISRGLHKSKYFWTEHWESRPHPIMHALCSVIFHLEVLNGLIRRNSAVYCCSCLLHKTLIYYILLQLNSLGVLRIRLSFQNYVFHPLFVKTITNTVSHVSTIHPISQCRATSRSHLKGRCLLGCSQQRGGHRSIESKVS